MNMKRRGLHGLPGKEKAELSKVMIKEPTGDCVRYQLYKSKIKPIVKGTDISFHVDIESEGDLVENWNTKRLWTPSFRTY